LLASTVARGGLVALALLLCTCSRAMSPSTENLLVLDDHMKAAIVSDDTLARTPATTDVDAVTPVDRKKKYIDVSNDADDGSSDELLYPVTDPDPKINSPTPTFGPKPNSAPSMNPFNSPGTNFILNLRMN